MKITLESNSYIVHTDDGEELEAFPRSFDGDQVAREKAQIFCNAYEKGYEKGVEESNYKEGS